MYVTEHGYEQALDPKFGRTILEALRIRLL